MLRLQKCWALDAKSGYAEEDCISFDQLLLLSIQRPASLEHFRDFCKTLVSADRKIRNLTPDY